MPLSPLTPPEERIEEEEEQRKLKDWYLDVEKGELRNRKVTNKKALKQWIKKALKTARFRYLIYSDEYGSELEDAIGREASRDLIDTEIPRFIREALTIHDRISDITNVTTERKLKHTEITFKVVLEDGTVFDEGVTL